MDQKPLRVIIRVCVTEIPGERENRVYRLGTDFCMQHLNRPLNNNLQAECHDAVHFLPNFDSENDVRAWFIYDFNVTGSLERAQILEIQHRVYHSTRQGESIFTPRERWMVEARKYCSMYTWGGSYKTE
ncbi:hypothetical protein BKA61DRAFT_479327 [Leptodontidium sp. MPI-SDFR-AT-0119]|nr:hypothetical protein BKA61DRAFT_479327 [Leptodontidium sp. MPI-SDFR-AT-0119]